MARWKNKRRYSTNVIKMKFQSFMDISTNDTSMQIITISAGGPEIVKRLAPQFGAYKYYRIGRISAKLVPASTLPVDPTGLSITSGDNLVDPRDQLTPGMMRITNGEDVFENISGLSDAEQHGIYNNMLLDPRWYKWMLQSGTKRTAFPRYWQIGQLHQDKYPGAFVNVPRYESTSDPLLPTTEGIASKYNAGNNTFSEVPVSLSSHLGLFQTGHKGVLGWLPTDHLQAVLNAAGNNVVEQALLASPPEVEVFKILLPKAYKTRYWYRLFITEEVWFREPIVNFGIGVDIGSGVMAQFRPLDVFHNTGYPVPVMPSLPVSDDFPTDHQTGGNYGND